MVLPVVIPLSSETIKMTAVVLGGRERHSLDLALRPACFSLLPREGGKVEAKGRLGGGLFTGGPRNLVPPPISPPPERRIGAEADASPPERQKQVQREVRTVFPLGSPLLLRCRR